MIPSHTAILTTRLVRNGDRKHLPTVVITARMVYSQLLSNRNGDPYPGAGGWGCGPWHTDTTLSKLAQHSSSSASASSIVYLARMSREVQLLSARLVPSLPCRPAMSGRHRQSRLTPPLGPVLWPPDPE